MQTAALVEEPTLWLSAPTEAYQQWQRTEAAGADRRAFSPRSIVQHEERVARSKSIWLECAFFVRTKRLWSECSDSKSMWSGCKSPQTAYFLSGALPLQPSQPPAPDTRRPVSLRGTTADISI